jgi:hypothetical protein
MTRRRLAAVKISSELLTKRLQNGAKTCCKCLAGLPADAELESVSFDETILLITLIFYSPEFGEIKDGEELPEIVIYFKGCEYGDGSDTGDTPSSDISSMGGVTFGAGQKNVPIAQPKEIIAVPALSSDTGDNGTVKENRKRNHKGEGNAAQARQKSIKTAQKCTENPSNLYQFDASKEASSDDNDEELPAAVLAYADRLRDRGKLNPNETQWLAEIEARRRGGSNL